MSSSFENQEQEVNTAKCRENYFFSKFLNNNKKIEKTADDSERRVKKNFSKEDISSPKNCIHLSHPSLFEEIIAVTKEEIESKLQNRHTVPKTKSFKPKKLCEHVIVDSDSLSVKSLQLSDSSSVKSLKTMFENINEEICQTLPRTKYKSRDLVKNSISTLTQKCP